MKKKTRQLAQQIKQALLDLPAATLLDTVDHWLKDLDSLFEDDSVLDGLYRRLGYRACSEATKQSYSSLEELYEAEPEETATYWELPAAQDLHETLRRTQPAAIYRTVIALAEDVLSQKAFALQWGEPPGGNPSSVFMQRLTHYLILRRGAPDISTAQFEEIHEAALETILGPEETERGSSGADDLVGFPEGEGTFHFRVVFCADPSAPERRTQLLLALRQYHCYLPDLQPEDGILGSLPYCPQSQRDLKTLARLRGLLSRWQRHGWITWTSRKDRPTRQERTHQRGRGQKQKAGRIRTTAQRRWTQ